MNGCCTHYHHQHRHWRNRLRRSVWSSHLPRSPFLFISTWWWWWKSRVHAHVMMMITIMFAATSVSSAASSSQHQTHRRRHIEPPSTSIDVYIDGCMSSNRTLSRKCLFDSSNCFIRVNVRKARRSCLIFYLHAILPPLWSLLRRVVSVNVLFTLLIERAIAPCWLFVGQINIYLDIVYSGERERNSLIIIIAGV